MIYLEYASVINNTIQWSASMSFETLHCIEKIITQRNNGISLRNILIAHLLSKRRKWDICISCDELINSDKLEFLKLFYSAEAWQISFDNWQSRIEVILEEQGEMPLLFINDNTNFSEFSFNLIEKNKSGV